MTVDPIVAFGFFTIIIVFAIIIEGSGGTEVEKTCPKCGGSAKGTIRGLYGLDTAKCRSRKCKHSWVI